MSLTKSKLKELRELSHKKFRDENKLFLVEGLRFVHEAVHSDFQMIAAYYTDDVEKDPHGKPVIQSLKHKTDVIEKVSAHELETICDTETPQGIVAVLRQKESNPDAILRCADGQCTLVAFDGVADPGNVGSMVRTCDWFGVNGILIGRNSVELYNPKVLRSTMGGVFHLPIADGVDLPTTLSKAKSLDYKIYVTDPDGEVHYDHVTYDCQSIIVFGNEAWGVSDQVRELADTRVVIRRYGAGESLNVGAACGIVLSALHRLID